MAHWSHKTEIKQMNHKQIIPKARLISIQWFQPKGKEK